MNKEQIINETIEHIKKNIIGDSGHDWWHVYRVWKTAVQIAEEEKADIFVVQLAALLHDIADYKFHGGDHTVGPKVAREFLQNMTVEENIINHICDIIQNMSFKGAGVESKMATKEGMIVQDADRLDALGAIRIARCFSYGGFKKRIMFDPSIKPRMHYSVDEYLRGDGTTINHFYEKLLLLKDKMNTKTGQRLAQERHEFLLKFLEQFYKEWDVEK